MLLDQLTTTINSPASSLSIMLIVLVMDIIFIVAYWKMFVKAGEAGWKSIIPLYSHYILFRIAGRNGWWFLALLVPIVNIFVLLMLAIDLAKHFGKSTAFGVIAIWIFSIIGYLILGLGDAKYVGPKHD